jgi:hypothetical protein
MSAQVIVFGRVQTPNQMEQVVFGQVVGEAIEVFAMRGFV